MAKLQKLKYPVGVQSFKWLRSNGYVYVDKTALLYELAAYGKYYFLSRPRRFGKSLMLSTFESYFLGERELFEGLAMETLEQDWIKRPVLHLDLSPYDPTGADVKEIITANLVRWEKKYGIDNQFNSLSVRFKNVIIEAHEKTGQRVAILIDEYDAPMIPLMDEEKRLNEVRDLLRSVFINLKVCDEHIQFAIITGVSRFSKVSVFSGLNNLEDISFDTEFSDICGVTETELVEYFRPGIEELAAEMRCSFDDALTLLKENYDGYHFTRDSADIYNPFSLLQALKKKEIASYWYQSGRASMIVKHIDSMSGYLQDILNNEKASAATLTEIESYRQNPAALLFQAGYLTIKGYNPGGRIYTLGIANREVREGLYAELAADRLGTDSGAIRTGIWEMQELLNAGKPDEALERIRVFMSRIPYDITPKTPEIYFENNLYLIFSLVGIDTRVEWRHAEGRVDMLLMMRDFIYILELKLDGTPEQAIGQIEEKNYALPFADDPRRIYLIGLSFCKESRNIGSWLIKSK